MEGDQQRRRQYGHSSFPRGYVPDARARPGNTTSVQNVGRVVGLEGSERFRQPQMTTSHPPTSAAMSVNATTHDMSSFGSYSAQQHYTSPQLPGHGGSFQYQAEYAQDSQRQQPYPQQYPSQLRMSLYRSISRDSRQRLRCCLISSVFRSTTTQVQAVVPRLPQLYLHNIQLRRINSHCNIHPRLILNALPSSLHILGWSQNLHNLQRLSQHNSNKDNLTGMTFFITNIEGP